ncbi:MAG: ABC transporter substrate binding protein [Alphaproteobacteria bacterium]
MTNTTNRRLAAILAADVAGYSRLMSADEEDTLARLKAIRAELIDPAIAAHHGRIVKTTGDGLLVEFGSVVEAVRCAVAIQRAIAEDNAGIAPANRLEFRIGIHVGDIIVDGEDDDIYGEGVNIAARLEALALPGSICLSARVHEDVIGRIDADFEEVGEQALKNIGRSVRVYRLRLNGTSAELPARLALSPKPSGRASAESGLRQIGYVGVASRPVTEEFRRALAAYGYIDGQTLRIHYRWSGDVYSRYPDLLRELIQLPVELLVADATPAVAAAKRATTTIPIVMVGVGDPVAYGIVPSLMNPDGNITGISGGLYDYLPRSLRLVREIMPESSRVAILSPAANPGTGGSVKLLEDTAHTLDMIPRAYSAMVDELPAVLAAIDPRTDVLVVIPDQGFALNRSVIIEGAMAAKIAVVCPLAEYVPDGALMSLGPNRNEVYRRLAYFVDAILKGTPPQEIPIEEPANQWLSINLRIARILGITIPRPILMRANELIE